jgi:geranylgeranyl diphosphate synthase type II
MWGKMFLGGAGDVRFDTFRLAIDEALAEIAIRAAPGNGTVALAFNECLQTPGKRLRPFITLLTTDVLGGSAEASLAPACAVEMIHTASLIVDDLPSMDDAKIRRGVPACHIKYGEDIALLTAIALLNEAYQVIANAPGLSHEVRTSLASVCADAVGLAGLIGGQEKDLRGRPEELDATHREKTGALFIAAAKAGAIVAGLPKDRIRDVALYASHLGLAFQTLDDIVDACGNTAMAGKDVDQDVRGNVVSLVGRDRAIKRLMLHVQRAVTALKPCGPSAEPLGNLARSLVDGAHSVAARPDATEKAEK